MYELADAVHELRLVRLQVTDEVPAERVAVLGVLTLELLRAVLAHHLDTRLDEHGHVGKRDVLRGGDDRDVLSDLLSDALVRGADGVRRRSRSPLVSR